MSGSPVYVDGKLIGAVSYALGSFSKEPIAGITPIAEMTDSTAQGNIRPPGARVKVEFPLTREGLSAAFRKALTWNRPFAERPNDTELSGIASVAGMAAPQLGTLLRPIATPLVMSGFEPDLADMFGGAFRDQGFIPTGGSVAGMHLGEKPYEGPLKPGDAVGVMLVGGDLMLGGTGTVTHIDGDRVYAFGHPMYNLGPTEFPMTRAYVYTVLPSLFSSMKLSTTGEIIGTVLQDRAAAIAGRLGSGPRMIPIAVSLESTRASRQSFHFTVVNDPCSTADDLRAHSEQLGSYERQFGAAASASRLGQGVEARAIAFDNLRRRSVVHGRCRHIVGPLTA
jgi:hypothetical protein